MINPKSFISVLILSILSILSIHVIGAAFYTTYGGDA